MTTYRFPEILGGGEHEATDKEPTYMVGFDLDGFTELLWIERACLTEVKPSLPEEPPVGAYRIGGVLCMRVSSKPNKCWVYQTADELFDEKTFEALCSDHGRDIVRLVPAPVAEPVTLPWRAKPGTREVTVSRDEHPDSLPGGVFVEIADPDDGVLEIWLPQKRAQDMARAINTAAEAKS